MFCKEESPHIFFNFTNLLAQLVAPCFDLLGVGDGLAAAFIEGAEISKQRSGIGSAGA